MRAFPHLHSNLQLCGADGTQGGVSSGYACGLPNQSEVAGGETLQEAMQLLERARELAPDMPQVSKSLAATQADARRHSSSFASMKMHV
jgi:hypothetical protein